MRLLLAASLALLGILLALVLPGVGLILVGSGNGTTLVVAFCAAPGLALCAAAGRVLPALTAALYRSLDARAPILYLRPFYTDMEVLRPHIDLSLFHWLAVIAPGLLTGFEESTVAELGRFGPVICLEAPTLYPGLQLLLESPGPHLLVARDDIDPREWKERVSSLCKESQLVLLHVGASKSLLWEMDHVLRTVPRERVVVIPPVPPLRDDIWQSFTEQLTHGDAADFPRKLGNTALFTFGSDGKREVIDFDGIISWEPERLPPPDRPIYKSAMLALIESKVGLLNEQPSRVARVHRSIRVFVSMAPFAGAIAVASGVIMAVLGVLAFLAAHSFSW